MKSLQEVKDEVTKKVFHFRYKNLLEKLSSNNHNFTETEIDHLINEVASQFREASSTPQIDVIERAFLAGRSKQSWESFKQENGLPSPPVESKTKDQD